MLLKIKYLATLFVGCGLNLFTIVNRNQFHNRIETRGCMMVIEDTIINEVCPLLKAYVLGGLLQSVVMLVVVVLAWASVAEINREVVIYEGEEGEEKCSNEFKTERLI